MSQSIFLFPKILFLASSFWTVSSGKVFSNEHESPIQSNSWNDETKQANICHCFIRLERMWVWTFQKCIGWFERSSQTAFEKIYFRACQRWQFEPCPKTLALLTHQRHSLKKKMFISFWVRACHWIILRTVSKTGMGNLKAGGGGGTIFFRPHANQIWTKALF